MRPPVLLVVAKAPVPGQVKTRLIGPFTPHQAAALAAAALLDTLDACTLAAATTGGRVVVALAGEIRSAVARDALAERLRGLRVIPQRGTGLAERLVHAHADAAGAFGGCVQVGMDTPQVTADQLVRLSERISSPDGADAVLGPATDGGWWVLGLRRAGAARCLAGVPMSLATTGADTLAALRAECHRVELAPALTDVDTLDDVLLAASGDGRFARLARVLLPEPEPVR